MNLAQELRDQVAAYVRDDISLADLHDWLATHVQDVCDSRDQDLADLDALAWILISELDYGHRTEESAKRELAARLWSVAFVTPTVTTSATAVTHEYRGWRLTPREWERNPQPSEFVSRRF